MKLIFKNLNLLLKIISWIQIIGGIAGLALMAYLMLRTDTINGPVLFIFLIGIGLFIFSIYCGKTLLSKNELQKGIILSLINQGLQFIQWCILGYGISYSSPWQFLIGLKGPLSFDLNLSIISTFYMSYNTSDGFFLKINLIAIFTFVVLINIYKKLKTEQKELIIATEPGA
jgi:hypothetical protein